MRSAKLPIFFCLILFCSNHPSTASADTGSQPTNAAKPTPLILEKDEGERRVWRAVEGLGPQPENFILKVDPQNGGSSHLVFGSEDLEPGGKIEMHKHPGSDEILFFQNGTAKVSLGDSSREVHGGATVFIPANTWISAINIGSEAITSFSSFLHQDSRNLWGQSLSEKKTKNPTTKSGRRRDHEKALAGGVL